MALSDDFCPLAFSKGTFSVHRVMKPPAFVLPMAHCI
jgi:hypothetical protein